MKRIQVILIFLVLVLSLQAKTIEINEAKSFVSEFIKLQSKSGFVFKNISEIKTENQLSSYFFELSPSGFVIISANDKVEPIIAYSFDSEATAPSEWPEQLKWWIGLKNKEIVKHINNKKAQRNPAWDSQTELLLKSANAKVDPLIKVIWGQGNKWNMFCPIDEKGPGGRAYVGCVAVSMAQAMSVFKYPENGKGIASYIHRTYGTQTVNFSKQSPYQWDSMLNASPNIHNARLLYHCAVTVQMDFGADGSGATTKAAVNALRNYFSYSKTTKYYSRVDDDEQWKQMLNESLIKGCPIIYHGDADDGQAGHAFNIDGVDNMGYYHLNWGWTGSMNAYFNINNLAPGSNNFTKNQGAIMGIKPIQPGPIDIALSRTSVKEKLPAGSFVAAVSIDDEYANNQYSYSLKGNPKVIGDGYAPAKFYIENDSLKTVEEFDFDKRKSYTLFIEVVDTFGNSLEEKFEISIEKAVGLPEITEQKLIEVYPNPVGEMVSIVSKTHGELCIFNLLGQKVFYAQVNEGVLSIDTSQLPKGTYIVQLSSNSGKHNQKLVKQ